MAKATKTEATPTYEEARGELGDVVRRLEAGGVSLEESIALWERGEVLAEVAQEWLEGARRRLDEAVAARTAEGDQGANQPQGGE
jgi:exodeoxyribonuclease VII small subunit